MENLLSTVAFMSAIGLLAWVGWGLEPHWASRDGRKFMCRMQRSTGDESGRPRWQDVKVAVDDGELFVLARSRRARDLRGRWRVVGAVDDEQRKRRIYEVRGDDGSGASLRVPRTSRCVPVLEELIP